MKEKAKFSRPQFPIENINMAGIFQYVILRNFYNYTSFKEHRKAFIYKQCILLNWKMMWNL